MGRCVSTSGFRTMCVSISNVTCALLVLICFNQLTINGKAHAQTPEINPSTSTPIVEGMNSTSVLPVNMGDNSSNSVDLFLDSSMSSSQWESPSSSQWMNINPSSSADMSTSSLPPLTGELLISTSPSVAMVQTIMPSSTTVSSSVMSVIMSSSILPMVDHCDPNPCENNGQCQNDAESFSCMCEPGWNSSLNCSQEIDECDPNPCEHGGNCTDHLNYFNCTCTLGYSDHTCSTDIDDCAAIDCMNGGECKDLLADYWCNCTSGWTGELCDQDIDECENETVYVCNVHSSCQNTQGGYNCSCRSGFSGDGNTGCTKIDYCLVNPCENGGICANIPDGEFCCFCTPGWTGFNCSTDFNECEVPSSCDVNAECENFLNGMYKCTCKDGFKGDGQACIEIMLFPDSPNATEFRAEASIESVYGPYLVDGGIPYYGNIHNQIYVSMNGYVVLGKKYLGLYPPSIEDLADYVILAPFWAAIDTSLGSGRLLISQYNIENTESLQKLSDLINVTDYTPKSAVVASWLQVSPYPAATYADKETASFQAIVATDRKQTYVMFNYDIDKLTWNSRSEDRRILIGRTIGGDGDFSITTESLANGTVRASGSPYNIDLMRGNKGKTGRWIYDGGVAMINPKDACLTWYESVDRRAILKYSPSCPCGSKQAQNDPNYVYNSTTMKAVPKYGTNQQCTYDRMNGYLLKGYPGGGYPVVTDADLANVNQSQAWTECCDGGSQLCNLFYKVFPSDDCSGYKQPKSALSWGDPHILTLDGKQYTYNGLGEYILLKTGLFEAQCRTSQVHDSTGADSNATVFTALALKDKDSKTVELRYDPSTRFPAVHIDGSNVSASLANDASPVMQTNVKIYRVNNSTVQMTFPMSQISFEVTQGIGGLGIVTYLPNSVVLSEEGKGLLGRVDGKLDNDFEFRNGTVISINSTESQIYEFGNSWRVNSTESLFNYSLDAGQVTHAAFDHPEFVPIFYSDQTIEERFPNETVRAEAIALCNDNLACQVDFAATGNTDLATQTKMEQETADRKAEELANNAPVFSSTMYPTITLRPGQELTIPLVATDVDGDEMTYDYQNLSSLPENAVQSELDNENNLKLMPILWLRNTTVSLRVLASDTKGGVVEYWPEVQICACRNSSECDMAEFNSVGRVVNVDRFYRSSCQCQSGYTGDFCTEVLDLCKNPSACYEGVNCTQSDTPGEYTCDPCPPGLVGDGTKCFDVNECLPATDCEQDCFNTRGSYKCTCRHGYHLDSNQKNCTDINECLDRETCSSGEYCINTEGSHLCPCMPGYYNRSGKCEKDMKLREYKGYVRFTAARGAIGWDEKLKDTNTDEFKKLVVTVVKSLTSVYNFTDNFHSLRVTGFREGSVISDYIVTYDSEVPITDINAAITKALGDCTSSCRIDQLVLPSSDDLNITVKDFCISHLDNDCDPLSTMCMNSNGTYKCPCLPGFKFSNFNSNSKCDDIDECLESPPCGSAKCANTFGNYTCSCEGNLILEELKCVDKCDARPCKNGGTCMVVDDSFACKCSEDWTGLTCENNKAEDWKEILIIVASVVGGVCLIAIIIIIILCCRWQDPDDVSIPSFGNIYDRTSYSSKTDTRLVYRRKDTSKQYSGVNSNAGDSDSSVYQGWSGKIPRPRRTTNELEMVENGAGRTTVGEYEDIGNDGHDKPLTEFKKRPLEGQDNPAYSENPRGSNAPRGERGSNEYF